jgi:hypothetical protein
LLVIAADGRLKRLALEFLGGPQQLVDTLCRSLGLGIDQMVIVDMGGVRDIIDAAGGVVVTLNRPRWDSVVRFPMPSGENHLNGDQAIAYMRSRHLFEFDKATRAWAPVPTVDRGRRAESVLRSTLRSASPSVFHPLRTLRLAWAVSGGIDINHGFGVSHLFDLANALKSSSETHFELPAETDASSQIPFAKLQPGAQSVLRQLGSGGAACRIAALPEARS